MRKTMLAGAAAGATMLGAAAIYYSRDKATPGPEGTLRWPRESTLR